MKRHPIIIASEMVGGQKELAALLDLTAPNLTQWINGSRMVPLDRCAQIQSITGGKVTFDQLRPDLADLFRAIRSVR